MDERTTEDATSNLQSTLLVVDKFIQTLQHTKTNQNIHCSRRKWLLYGARS